jgi:hypothetical protein
MRLVTFQALIKTSYSLFCLVVTLLTGLNPRHLGASNGGVVSAEGCNESGLLAGDRQRVFQRARFRIDTMEHRRRSAPPTGIEPARPKT